MARPTTAWGSLPFFEQIAFFKDKVDMPTQSWLDLLGAGHDRAFVVAGAMKADLLADLHAAVLKAIEQGTTLDTFRKDFNSIVAKRGWTGWTGEDTPEGRAWRQEIIYGTNLRTSYQAGRYAQAQAIAHRRPYWRYRHNDTVHDPRPLHVAWDGLILRADDPWWKTRWPPSGFGCRCRIETLAQRDLDRMGKSGPDPTPDDGTYEWLDKRTGKTHTLPKGVDPGWDYTPGATRDLIAEVKAKAAGLPGKLGEALAQDVAQLAPNGPDWHARSPSDLDAVLERGRLREAELFGTSSKNMDALADKLKRLEADEEMKFNATFADDSDWRSFEALDSAVAATKKARQAGENAMEKTLKGMRAKIVEAEALLRESGVDIPKATAKAAKIEIKDYGYSLVKDVRSQAADFYKQFGVNAGNVAGIFDDPLRKRAYCQNWGHANGDLINLGDSVADKRTLWHEMGHSVEFTDGTGDVARAWLTRRATGAPIKLNDLLNTDVYRDNEIAFPDYFFDAYVGKDYGSSTTEVLSMGLENFISAKSLLDFWLKDREHFRLILGLLRL